MPLPTRSLCRGVAPVNRLLHHCNRTVTHKSTAIEPSSMSKVVRIDEEALAVALGYGKNLSAGIMKMEELLRKQEKVRRDYTAIEEMIRRTIREELEVLTSRY